MAGSELSGIERQLVLQYLIDGNTPITVTPVEESGSSEGEKEKIKSDSSRIFPVALRAEQMTVLDQGIILLKNPPENIKSFDGKDVRVQFYFNKIGLYFVTKMKKVSSGPAIVIPAAIQRVTEEAEIHHHPFSAILYYALRQKDGDLHIDCQFDENYRLFSQPKWSDVDENDAQNAKVYLEKAVEATRNSGASIGNRLILIPVCRYLAHKSAENVALQGIIVPPTVLYIDHERIVFGTDKKTIAFAQGAEYALKLGFPLPKPLKEREVYVTCMVEQIFADNDEKKLCAVCKYTSIKEEDVRYLYDFCNPQR
ncbi:MAG: hypothetical protein IJP62_11670 [Treponema sp.]|nr:hypothetical protein [Treponema sp.]